MFSEMQDFDFAQFLISFAQISPNYHQRVVWKCIISKEKELLLSLVQQTEKLW